MSWWVSFRIQTVLDPYLLVTWCFLWLWSRRLKRIFNSQAQIWPAESFTDGQERGDVPKRGEELGPGTIWWVHKTHLIVDLIVFVRLTFKWVITVPKTFVSCFFFRITVWPDRLSICHRISSRNKPLSSKTSLRDTRWQNQPVTWFFRDVNMRTLGSSSPPPLLLRAPSLKTSQRPPTTFSPLCHNKTKVDPLEVPQTGLSNWSKLCHKCYCSGNGLTLRCTLSLTSLEQIRDLFSCPLSWFLRDLCNREISWTCVVTEEWLRPVMRKDKQVLVHWGSFPDRWEEREQITRADIVNLDLGICIAKQVLDD